MLSQRLVHHTPKSFYMDLDKSLIFLLVGCGSPHKIRIPGFMNKPLFTGIVLIVCSTPWTNQILFAHRWNVSFFFFLLII